MLAAHLQDQLATVKVRHHKIGDDKVDGARVVENRQRLTPIARSAGEVAEPGEKAVQRQPDAALVIDDEHMRDRVVSAVPPRRP